MITTHRVKYLHRFAKISFQILISTMKAKRRERERERERERKRERETTTVKRRRKNCIDR